jgi:hypothetical protein
MKQPRPTLRETGSTLDIWLVPYFFDKEHILILQRYQLHPASATTHYISSITDAHNQKRKKNYIEISCYSDIFLETAALTPPRQHQKSSFSKSDAFKKGIVHKRCRRPIIDLRFSP